MRLGRCPRFRGGKWHGGWRLGEGSPAHVLSSEITETRGGAEERSRHSHGNAHWTAATGRQRARKPAGGPRYWRRAPELSVTRFIPRVGTRGHIPKGARIALALAGLGRDNAGVHRRLHTVQVVDTDFLTDAFASPHRRRRTSSQKHLDAEIHSLGRGKHRPARCRWGSRGRRLETSLRGRSSEAPR